MAKLKVLHIVEALSGGVYSYFKDLAAVLEKDDTVENTIIYSEKREGIDPSKIRSKISSKIKLIVIPMQRELSLKADSKAVFALRDEIKKIKPQVVHLHSSKAGVLGRAAHLLSRSKAPLFYTPHGYAFLRKDVSPSTLKMYHFIERAVQYVRRGTTIACGDTEYDYAKKIGPAILIRNGINIEEVRRHKNDPETGKKLIVGVLGRVMPQKNPELFNKVALENPHIHFIWIGDGELRASLNAPNIEVTGWFTSRTAGLRLLNKVDIYLQTSAWEGLPIALLEAMALEKPIIATDIIGNKDVVIHGKTGFLCTEVKEFNEALQKLNNIILREEMGKAGLKRCRTYFNSTKNYQELLKVYKTAVS